MIKPILLFLSLSFILRILFIYQGGISFHYDMARDAYEAQTIWKDFNLKILGPPTSTPGLYHGVLYYYLIAPFYLLGNGNPVILATIFSFINSVVLIPIMFLAKDIFKDRRWAYLAGLLYAVSFEATQYGPWISNPAPAVLTVALFFLFLRWWQKGNINGLYLSVLSAVLSAQFQFFLIYLSILIPLFGIIFKIKTAIKPVIFSLIIFTLGFSSFILSAIKFNTLPDVFKGLLNIAAAGQIDFRAQFTEVFLNYINRITELYTNNFLPTNVFLGGLLTIFAFYFIRKEPLILFFIFSNLPVYIFGGHTNTYANIGLVVPAILSVLLILKRTLKIDRRLFFILILLSLISNIYSILSINPKGQVILVIPNDMNLKNQLQLIDDTYKIAAGQPFSINTITLPLWINTTWAYLYQWYGKGKYGYVPHFYGRDQVGLLGVNSLQKIDKPLQKTFLIAEPGDGIPAQFYNEELNTENSKTILLSEKNYGSIKLQIRVPKTDD